jgi:hypothetical protein
MLESNFRGVRVLQNIGGTKHNKIDFRHQTDLAQVESDLTIGELSDINQQFAAKQVPYMYIFKHPAAWLKSYARYEKAVVDTNYIEKNMGIYNMLNHHWALHCHPVNYHRLIQSPVQVLTEMYCKYNLVKSETFPATIYNTTKRGGDTAYPAITSPNRFSNEYYTQKQYLNEFSDNQRRLIDQLDTFYNNGSA